MSEVPQSRYGARVMSADNLRPFADLIAALFVLGGISILAVAGLAEESVAHPMGALFVGFAAVVIGLTAALVERSLDKDRTLSIQPLVAVVGLFGSGLFISCALYLLGLQEWSAGVAWYMPPAILSFVLLTTRLALVFVASLSAEFAVLCLATDGMSALFPRWLALTLGVVAGCAVMGGFAERTDRLAASEHDARLALEESNHTLEARVASQVDELTSLQRLRRFLPPQVADAVLSTGEEDFLAPHRREIAVLFCDLRGFTAFAGRVEPEEVLDALNAYHRGVGDAAREYQATVGQYAGDGVMAYFNDPVLCDDPPGTALRMALRVREHLDPLVQRWDRLGYHLSYGIGLAYGHATLGVIGAEGRHDYTPLGTVVNLAARLCAEAQPGQILVDQRVHAALDDSYVTTPAGELWLKGFTAAVPAYEVCS